MSNSLHPEHAGTRQGNRAGTPEGAPEEKGGARKERLSLHAPMIPGGCLTFGHELSAGGGRGNRWKVGEGMGRDGFQGAGP